MINQHPTVREMALLHSVCRKFIRDNNIKSKFDVDGNRIMDETSAFIVEICDIVGYDNEK